MTNQQKTLLSQNNISVLEERFDVTEKDLNSEDKQNSTYVLRVPVETAPDKSNPFKLDSKFVAITLVGQIQLKKFTTDVIC